MMLLIRITTKQRNTLQHRKRDWSEDRVEGMEEKLAVKDVLDTGSMQRERVDMQMLKRLLLLFRKA
jgi:hypothetical protein